MKTVVLGRTLQRPGSRWHEVFFPNGGVYSVVNEMRDGALVEVATVGCEGMLGIGVFLGDRSGGGRTLLQNPDGRLPAMAATRFIAETAVGPFRVWSPSTRRRTCCRSCRAPPAMHCMTSGSGVAAGCCRRRIESARTNFFSEAGLSGHHARRPSSDRDRGDEIVAALRAD